MKKLSSYSGLFIITPEKQDSIDEVTGRINAIIGENSGSIAKGSVVGKKALAYPIKKKNEGIYYEVAFTSPTETVAKMIRQFRIDTDILRALIDKA